MVARKGLEKRLLAPCRGIPHSGADNQVLHSPPCGTAGSVPMGHGASRPSILEVSQRLVLCLLSGAMVPCALPQRAMVSCRRACDSSGYQEGIRSGAASTSSATTPSMIPGGERTSAITRYAPAEITAGAYGILPGRSCFHSGRRLFCLRMQQQGSFMTFQEIPPVRGASTNGKRKCLNGSGQKLKD